MAENQQKQRRQGRERLRHLLAFNIRSKIILPYLILTLGVAIVGTYVVISLVASSLDERLNNHLLEAGRVVSDTLARQEVDHIGSVQIIAYTRGLAEAIEADDRQQVAALAEPAASGMSVETLLLTNATGQEMLHILLQPDGSFERVEGSTDVSSIWLVENLLAENDPEALPRRGIGLHPVDQRYYYFTAIPIPLENEVAGVAVIGTALDTLLPEFAVASLADVTIHLDSGRAVATTLASPEGVTNREEWLSQLSIPPDLYEESINSTDTTVGQNISLYGRSDPYRLAHGPLRVGNETIGVFTVALPSNFILERGTTSRNTYVLIFSIATGLVVLTGYLISRLITNPLQRLVHTSQAVADGDLQQRTNIQSSDEIGLLASTFDHMTGRLALRTHELEEALGRMRAILLSIGDGVLLEDTEGNLVPLNATAERMLQELTESFTLSPLRELAASDSEEVSGDADSPWLLESRRFEVGRKVVSVHTAAVRAESGERLGTVIVLRDVTAEVEAERLKDAFVAHVSHELRTPLTAIKGYSDLLLISTVDTLDEQERGFLSTISHHTNNLVAMIEELLDFSEMEASGQLALQRQPVTLSDIIADIVESWEPLMEGKGLSFQAEIAPDLPLINADPRRLHWAIVNLVRNAYQYTPEDGHVSLKLSTRDSLVVLDITDTGPGFSPEDLKPLFTRFYRASQEQIGEVRGLGLGLYVTKSIVEAHGGEIQISTEEDRGSTFTILLPTLQDASQNE